MRDQRLISSWLNCGKFKTDIDSALTNILRYSEHSNSESETSNIFEREIYFLIRQETGFEINFQKETPVEGVVHTFGDLATRTSGRGRLDSVVNNLVIEYKHHKKLSTITQRQTAYEQVKDYLKAIYHSRGEKCDAILTDGLKIAYFSFVEDEVSSTSLRAINHDDIGRVINAILNNSTKKFEPCNIVNDFSISNISDSVSKDIANILFKELTENISDKTNMLYAEWKGLMHLSVEDNGKSNDIAKRRDDLTQIFSHSINDSETEYKALFALQTTYAIIVKLIACKVIDNLNFNQDTNRYHDLVILNSSKMQQFFQKMEDGYSYSQMGIRNFLEGDFFSWYSDTNQWNDGIANRIKDLIINIDEYSAFSLNVRYTPIDIFKDLYMSIIPQSIRHSMGEYFTPEWLSDCVISKALETIDSVNWRAIDPCCGSGIFVITLIKKIVGDICLNDLSDEDKKQLLNNILSRVYGIDINPLSVLSARVSYYLAIYQFGDIKDIEIPIYLGDSAIIPVTKDIDGIECYYYSVNNLKCESLDVVLPKRIVNKPDFGETMSKLQALVKTEESDLLYERLCGELDQKELNSPILLEHLRNLSDKLVFLHKNNWDGIWIRIATNFMLIARLKSFDMIVGNPPWVKWEHLPAAYTRKIKEFCDIRHIFCNDGGLYGGAQLNICALISNVTASTWLKDNGILAFLMPDSIMAQNSYEEFRNFYIDYESKKRLYLQFIDRWMAPLRPFRVGTRYVTQDFITYFFSSKEVDYNDGIQVREISRSRNVSDNDLNRCHSFESAQRHLTFNYSLAKQMSKHSTAFTYTSKEFDFKIIIGKTHYQYRTGVESTPFEIFKLLGVGHSEKKGHYYFKNKVLKTSKYKVEDIPPYGWEFPVEYIYPMVEGPSVKPFSYECGNNFHIIPYDRDNTKAPISYSKMLHTNEALAIYFANHKNIIDKQSEKSKTMHRGTEPYALSKIGNYTFAPYIVAARDNSYFCSSVVYPTMTPWGELKQSICVKHTIIISVDIYGNYITENEAHYINGILNSSIVRDYIHRTFKSNGFSLNKSHLFIPKYDEKNSLFKEIAEQSKLATQNEQYRDEAMIKLSQLYIELCKKYNK